MSTTSEVKAGLDAVSVILADSISRRANAKNNLLVSRNQLAALPTTYADVIAEINGYTPTGAFEELSKDELAKLTTEFQALKAAIETELTALGIVF